MVQWYGCTVSSDLKTKGRVDPGFDSQQCATFFQVVSTTDARNNRPGFFIGWYLAGTGPTERFCHFLSFLSIFFFFSIFNRKVSGCKISTDSLASATFEKHAGRVSRSPTRSSIEGFQALPPKGKGDMCFQKR